MDFLMFVLRDLLTPFQEQFSTTQQGQKEKSGSYILCLQLLSHFPHP